jgi:hypothetical protein
MGLALLKKQSNKIFALWFVVKQQIPNLIFGRKPHLKRLIYSLKLLWVKNLVTLLWFNIMNHNNYKAYVLYENFLIKFILYLIKIIY